jgi:Protein of unknown function (DUF3048) N-terminal domain/Protein of unknown function (DUF3048) C-terminal domain
MPSMERNRIFHSACIITPMRRQILLTGCLLLLAACGTKPLAPTTYVGVVIDNHEDAREWQQGLEHAPLVMEHLVEGFITRFLAVFPIDSLPDAVGPVRSIRPYVVESASPLVSAIFHVGGSPEGLDALAQSTYINGFNGIGLDKHYVYDEGAPAPHNRFINAANIRLLAGSGAVADLASLFPRGTFIPEESAQIIDVNYYSPVHNVLYAYMPDAQAYVRGVQGKPLPFPIGNVLILETDTKVVGPFGRLGIQTKGSGAVLLFRDGGMQRGTWSKAGDNTFFAFRQNDGTPLHFSDGRVWMMVLDSLDRVTWKSGKSQM